MESTFLPAPYGGVNELVPVSEINSPNCEELLNFNVDQGGISLRNGDSLYEKFTRAGGGLPLGIFPYGESTKLFAAILDTGKVTIDFIDCSSGAVAYSPFTAGGGILASVAFMKNIFFYSDNAGDAPGWVYDGTSWGAVGYTGSGITPIGGNVFNHRQYLIQRNDASYWYSGIDQISGACFKVDLNGLTQAKTTLSCIGSFTHVSPYGTSTNYQSFVMANGEVLFFTGGYPDSDDWAWVGSANVAQPLAPNAIIPYQGDTLLLTDAGPVSLRSLFLVLRDVTQTSSEESASLTLSAYAQKAWTELVQAIRSSLSTPSGPISAGYLYGSIRGVFDKKQNRIVISFPWYLDSSNALQHGNYFFVFDNLQKAWFFHRSFGGFIFDIARFENSVKMLSHFSSATTTFAIFSKEGSTGFMDRNNTDDADVGFDFQMLSAPIPYKKDAVYTIDGIEPLIESDLYSETNWTLVADFGRQETSAQVLGTDVLTTSIQKPQVNIGITANFAQVKMYGTTAAAKTVGLTLSGFNVWYDSGEKGSR